MKKNSDISLVKLLGKRLSEATILKPGYVEGAKFFYNGGFKKLDDAGYIKGDIFVVTKLKNKVDFATKAKEGEIYIKTLQAPDGKKFTFSGGIISYKTFFNQIKTGSSAVAPAGEDWEALIVVAHNNKFEGPEWERAEKFWESYGEAAQKIAKDFKSKLKQKSLKQFGSSRATLNKDWRGRNSTPKTDIIGSNVNISLKKKGGSQVLSGAKEEVISTFFAASKYVSKNETKMLQDFIDMLEQKMKTLYYDGTVTDLKNKIATGELKPKKDAVVKEYENMVLDIKQLTKMLNDEIFNSEKFKLAFTFEAATGTSKFSTKDAVADTLVGFDADNGVVSKILTVKKIEDVKSIADNTKFYFSFKSTGKNPMISLRGQLDDKRMGENKKRTNVKTLSEILVSEFGKFNKELGEGIEETLMSETSNINELNIMNNLTNFIEKIPGAVKGVKDKFVDIVKNIFEKISDAFKSIKEMGAKIIDGLMDFFGFDIDDEGTSVTSTDENFPIASLLSNE
jgi:hypothetical protein